MNKFFLTLIILFFPIFSFSQEQEKTIPFKIQGSKDLPLELNLLIDSLEENEIIDHENLLSHILAIDTYARVLNKEDIFLIGKIEIYKTLLKSNDVYPKASIDGDSLKTLKAAIKKSNDPFISWILDALLHDCEALLATANYKDYLLQKNNGRLEKLEYKKIDKKVQLLNRWVSKINPDTPDFIEVLKNELIPVMIEALKNIEESFFLMAKNSSRDAIPALLKSPKGLKFFARKEIMKKTPTPAKKEKTVEDILAPITDEGKTELALPEPSKEDWLNDDNAPVNLKNLPKPSNDADWLQDF